MEKRGISLGFSISLKSSSRKLWPIVLAFRMKCYKKVQIPCDISARSWGGTEICDSREAFGGGEGMLILVSEEW